MLDQTLGLVPKIGCRNFYNNEVYRFNSVYCHEGSQRQSCLFVVTAQDSQNTQFAVKCNFKSDGGPTIQMSFLASVNAN